MKVSEFKKLLDEYPDDAVIVTEMRVKTGYDEGDIYNGDPKLSNYRGVVIIFGEKNRLVGGW